MCPSNPTYALPPQSSLIFLLSAWRAKESIASKMGFLSFLGRVLFASVFILSAWQMFHEFGEDGGPAAKELAPKVAGLQDFLESKLGTGTPKIDVRHVVAAFMALKGLGGLLLVFGCFTGAFLLICYLIMATPLLHDFSHFNIGEPQYFIGLQEFLQCLALLGALLFFVGMKNSINRRLPKKKTLKSKTT